MGQKREEWTHPKLDALKLPEGLSDHRIRVERGLYLRLRRAGSGQISKKWEYRAKVAKLTRWLTLGEFPGVGLAEARRTLEKHQTGADKARRGEADHPAVTARAERKQALAEPTVKEAATEWLKAPRKRNGKPVRESTIALHLANLEADIYPVIGDVKIRHLTESQAEGCIERVVARGKMGQAAQVYKTLRRLIRYSIRPLKYLDHDPLANVANPKPYNPRAAKPRAMDDSELKAFLSLLDASDISDPVRLGIQLQLLTGTRPGEVRHMRREHFIKSRHVWRLTDSRVRTDKAIDIHLSPQALAVLDAAFMLNSPEGYVFSGKEGGMVSKMTTARAMARLSARLKEQGIDPVRPHDLRRTFRTVLARIGIAPHIAQRCINHADASPLDAVYNAHDYRPQMIEAWDKAGAHIAALLEGGAEVILMKKSE